MKDLIKELFFLFSMETGILGIVKENQEFLGSILLIIGTFACFLGFRIYRLIFSILTFMAIAISSIFFMRNFTDWGTITTTFSVLGTVGAFFSYRWHKLGGIIISVLISAAIGWIYTYSILVSILVGILVMILMLFFPVITIYFMTSLWGTLIIKEFLMMNSTNYRRIILSFIIFSTGFITQLIINKNQELFDKSYSYRLKNWIEKIGERHGDDI